MRLIIVVLAIMTVGLSAADGKLLNAIEKVESNGNPRAVSPKGARGAYQFMRPTWEWVWKDILKDPRDFEQAWNRDLSRKAAAAYLDWIEKYLKKHGLATEENIIAAYNAGVGSVRKARGIPNFKETKDYVRKVKLKKGI